MTMLYLHLRHSTRTLLRRCRRIRLPRGSTSASLPAFASRRSITWSLTKNAPRRSATTHGLLLRKLQKILPRPLPAAPPSRTASGPALEDSLRLDTSYGNIATALKELAPRRRRRSRIEPYCPVIPCHRIIGSDGSLPASPSVSDAKIWLLKHEGIPCGKHRKTMSEG